MSTTVTTTTDVAEQLVTILETVPDVRVYGYVPDTFRPSGIVVGQPDIDFVDNQSGFCSATWIFTLTIATARNTERDAQKELARIVGAVAIALNTAESPGLFSIAPLDASPITANVNGQDLPAYSMRVQVRA
jgi:hypothetical protein